VTVNGEILKSPARDVGPDDRVTVDGNPLARHEPATLWRFHKPRGCVTTHRDPEGRPTVFEKLPKDMPRVISIGRLDFNTEGLLLLTTDGGLARHFELPATGWMRRYRVRANGTVTQEQLDALRAGVELEGVRYGPIEATVDASSANVWLTSNCEGEPRGAQDPGSLTEVNLLIRSFSPVPAADLEEDRSRGRRVLRSSSAPVSLPSSTSSAPADERPMKNTGFVADGRRARAGAKASKRAGRPDRASSSGKSKHRKCHRAIARISRPHPRDDRGKARRQSSGRSEGRPTGHRPK
jgi:23S rRNA pseudouridine2605 synthase